MSTRAYIRMCKEAVQGMMFPPTVQEKVAMLHEGRCGSTVVGNLLDQHPLIDWEGELFQHQRNRFAGFIQLRYPATYIRWRRLRAQEPYYGFETKTIDHLHLMGLSLRAYIDKLRSIGTTRFIYLNRRNNLRRIVSNLVGRKRAYHIRADRQSPKLTTIKLDIDGVPLRGGYSPLLPTLHEYEEIPKQVDALVAPDSLLQLTYEDHILTDPRQAYDEVTDFLGIKAADVSITLRRTNPFELRDIVENYDEVVKALTGTRFEWMLFD